MICEAHKPEVTLALSISDTLFVCKKYRCIWTDYTAETDGIERKTEEKRQNQKLVLQKYENPDKPEVSFAIKPYQKN